MPIVPFLLNDTLPPAGPIVALLAAWAILAAAIAMIVRWRVRRQDVPWPSAVAAVAIFIAAFLIAIMADTSRFKGVFDAVATLTLMPAAPLAFGLDALIDTGSAPRPGLQHFALAASATIYWYVLLTGFAILGKDTPSVEGTPPPS